MMMRKSILPVVVALFFRYTHSENLNSKRDLQEGNIVDVAIANGFNTLVEAVTSADLVDTLSDPDAMYTVFAPTDQAFAAVEGLDAILADTDALTTLLLNHVVDGKVMAADLMNGQVVDAAGGEKLTVMISNDVVMINNAMVTVTDVPASNGIIHVIDAVLTFDVEPLGNIVDVAIANEFDTLVAAVIAADLVDALSDPDAMYTVFAPTDEAFAAVEGLDAILADTDALTTLLLNHVVDGKVMAEDLMNGQVVDAAGGEKLNVMISNDVVMINNAMVIVVDVPASNGVIHVIDAVLTFDSDDEMPDTGKKSKKSKKGKKSSKKGKKGEQHKKYNSKKYNTKHKKYNSKR